MRDSHTPKCECDKCEHWPTRMDEVDGDLERRGEERRGNGTPRNKAGRPPTKGLLFNFSGGTKYRGGEEGEDLCVCMPQMLKTFTFASPHSRSVPVCK